MEVEEVQVLAEMPLLVDLHQWLVISREVLLRVVDMVSKNHNLVHIIGSILQMEPREPLKDTAVSTG